MMMNVDLMVISVLVAVTAGLVEAIKQALDIPNKYLPVTAIFIGVASAVVYALGWQQDLVAYAAYGVIVGLSSAGLYDNIEQVIK